MTEQPEMVSIIDAAHELGIHPKSMHRLITRVGIQKYRQVSGRNVYIRRTDLESLRAYHPVNAKERSL
jgi:hypothetical protein